MKVRYRFRFYPTHAQADMLGRVFGCCRYVYNRGLRFRTDAWFERQEKVGYNASSAELTRWKREEETKWLNEVSCVPTQQALRHLNNAFVRFFNKEGAYPRFKKKGHRQSAEYTTSAFKFRRDDPKNPSLKLAGLGRLRVVWSRGFASLPTTVTVTKEPSGRYFVSLCLEETFSKLPATGLTCGVDLGINRLATVSDGQRIGNPKHTAKNQGRLCRAQRILSRREEGSERWVRQRIRVARVQEQIADARKDALDKATTSLVRKFGRISIEDLFVHGMVQNHCLAKSLSDVALGMFRRMLEYKGERYGREIWLVDRFYPSSKRCHVCGHVLGSLPLSVREWDCPECACHHDRDFNAAVNIDLAGGQPVTARGGRVRRFKPSGLKRNARGSVNHFDVGRALHV